MSKQFLKMSKYGEYVIFQVCTKEGQKLEKSSRFYCLTETLKNLKYNKLVIEKDIAHFLEITLNNDLLRMKFSFLENYGIDSITGKYYNIDVKFVDLVCFILEDTESKFLPNIVERNNCELILNTSIKSIINNKVLKKKIRKQLVRLKNVYSFKKCYIGLDYWTNSDLYFKYENGYNGGIIFHKDFKNPTDIRLGKYFMHT